MEKGNKPSPAPEKHTGSYLQFHTLTIGHKRCLPSMHSLYRAGQKSHNSSLTSEYSEAQQPPHRKNPRRLKPHALARSHACRHGNSHRNTYLHIHSVQLKTFKHITIYKCQNNNNKERNPVNTNRKSTCQSVSFKAISQFPKHANLSLIKRSWWRFMNR